MTIETQQITLRKLVADEGKVLRSKVIQKDDNGNEIPRSTASVVYLGTNESADNYEELEEE